MSAPDIKMGRLSADEIAEKFGDLHPPLSRPEALIEADRCYFCFDARVRLLVRQASTFRRLFRKFAATMCKVQPKPSSKKTSWAVCAHVFAPLKYCAKKHA